MKAPWHFWLIAILSLLWNAVGAFDYTMTQTQNAEYMSNFTPEQLDFFYGFPAWVDATWAIAVWFSVLGSVLLLVRSRLALWTFVVSFVGMILTTIHNFLLSEVSMIDLMGATAAAFSAVIFVIALFLIIYARRQKTKGVIT